MSDAPTFTYYTPVPWKAGPPPETRRFYRAATRQYYQIDPQGLWRISVHGRRMRLMARGYAVDDYDMTGLIEVYPPHLRVVKGL